MEMRDCVCVPISRDGGIGIDLGGVVTNEVSGMVCDELGNIISVDTSAGMQAYPWAPPFINRAIDYFTVDRIAVCTAQDPKNARLSIRNLFDEQVKESTDKICALIANLFADANKADNRKLFQRVASHLGVPVRNMLFVDDKIEAIISALQGGYGFAVLVNPNADCTEVETLLCAYVDDGHFSNVSLETLLERVFLVPSVAAITFPKRG